MQNSGSAALAPDHLGRGTIVMLCGPIMTQYPLCVSRQRGRSRTEALKAFANYGELRPHEWALIVRRWNRCNVYRDLKRLYRQGYLLRKRDRYNRLSYRLSSLGASWVAKNIGHW